MKEIWKDIAGYEGRYQVSNFGNVKSLAYKKHRILKIDINSNGYARVCLSNKKWFFVHRLVANAFVPNPHQLPVVNHLDENRLNNSFNNLEWCTQKQNLAYSNVGKKINADKCKKLIAINLTAGESLSFRSIREAERLGFNRRTIQGCIQGKYKQHKGYSWNVI